MSIILFIFLLTFLILIHELGHFVIALLCKVKIEEFGIGLPPKATTLFRWRGIPFTLNWIFLGGFVRMEGEDGTEGAIANSEQRTADSRKTGENSKFKIQNLKEDSGSFPFYTRPLLQKLAIVIAGPLVNFIFGIVVFSVLFSIYGIPVQVHSVPTIEKIFSESPAEKSGLQANDKIISVAEKDGGQKIEPEDNKVLIDFLAKNRGKTLIVGIERGEQRLSIDVYSRKLEETPQKQGALGIQLASQYQAKFYPGLEQLFRGTYVGLKQSVEFGLMILRSLGGLGRSLSHGNVPTDLSGPVGIARQAQEEKVFASGAGTALNFAALLSINLAIMNLLPIPALDGGRAVLLILEKFFKGKRFAILSNWLNTAGFVLLLSFLILITLKDVLGILF